MSRKKQYTSLILIIPAVLGLVILYLSTHWGPGIGGDATIYITSARNLLSGNGLGLVGPQGEFRLLPYFPPGFSLALSFPGLFGIDLVSAAHWLNILLFAALILLAGLLVYRISGSIPLALGTETLLVFSPILIPVYSWAMSEPLSIFLGFSSLALMFFYLGESNRRLLLFASGLLAGLAILSRYSAVAYFGAGALALLLTNSRRKWRTTLLNLAIYGGIGAVPAASWMIYDYMQTSTLASRSVESGLGMADRLVILWPQFKEVATLWLLPESFIYNPPYPLFINLLALSMAFLVLAVGGVFVLLKFRKLASGKVRDEYLRMTMLLSLFLLTYLFVITVVYVTTYPPITIGSRMLSPVHIALLWLAVLLIGMAVSIFKDLKWVRVVLTTGLLFFVFLYAFRSMRIVKQNYELGLGYTSQFWQNSDTIDAVEALPEDTLIVTNETNAILFLTGRASYPFAEIYWNEPLPVFTTYGDGDLKNDHSQRLFHEGVSPLVLFDTVDDQLAELYGDRTEERLVSLVEGLYRAFRGNDGGIFYYEQPR
jgi:hypothetical protein